MNVAFLIIIVLTLSISSFSSMYLFNDNANKWRIMLASLTINKSIIIPSSVYLYSTDVQMFHKSTSLSLGIFGLIIFIPIISLFNYYTIGMLKEMKR
ncbi:hypothetical protein WAK64_22105 [Bacillus spongiae]|uniref:Uncharacterized protein n=1 Tax=Bacillus spongiae TaxID=2683610 RepID=A0ABU8HKU0_9BACI